MNREQVTVDGNEAAAHVAYRTNEVVAIYPITPSSPMGEFADAWAAANQKNIWGMVPLVREMQSEGGAAGAVHGMLQTGSLTTTFTASQGFLLMIPNMFKIAGELTSTVFHVTARSLATHALSIFGDHSDVMAARSTGWGMLFANSVQEAMDFALIAQAATLSSRVPFVHVFDGFRTSHEVMKIEKLTDEDIIAMMDPELVRAHRARALSPDHPIIRGTAQNPDVYFQGRERVNPYYEATPGIVQQTMDKFASLVGRQYHLFDYVGAADAERIIVMMASGCETAEETIEDLVPKGEKIGLVKVRLFRPFSAEHLVAAIPATAKKIAVLDRTKEPGSAGEPLYQDVVTSISELMALGKTPFEKMPRIVGGRYGLGSKDFTPAMVKGVYDELAKQELKNHFSVGIEDDVTFNSIAYDPAYSTETDDVVRALFWGLGADGTVGANKNSIKIIGEETPNFAQGYFVYDSKKSGAVTISHLRFGPRPIHSSYLVQQANFVAVHQFNFLERYPVLDTAAPGATFLLNTPYAVEETWDQIPRPVQQQIIDKKLKFYAINAHEVAKKTGMGGRINTIMQTCFFAISGVLPRDEAISQIKKAIKKTYGKRGDAVVQKNFQAVDETLAHLHEIAVPATASSNIAQVALVPSQAPEFVRHVLTPMIAGVGDTIPVSAFPVDGTYPTGTAQWEKRNIALDVPVWAEDLCIQCGKCALVCPHATIRAKVVNESALQGAPEGFKHVPAKFRELADGRYTIQVAVEDCTGCRLCVETCPAKDKSNVSRKALNMQPQLPLRETGRENWSFFMDLPDAPRDGSVKYSTIKNIQLLQPLFEFSGACSGCGETPYVKLVSQLFGDRAIIANATGCSSIYSGNLPTTPYTVNRDGRGPAWSNSLFEDNAEFGLGMRMAVDHQAGYARHLIASMNGAIGDDLKAQLLEPAAVSDETILARRTAVASLKERLSGSEDPGARDLLAVCDALVDRSVWIVGGDGWAYDIGYGGLDHVLASGLNVNVLVLDTEVYSNTGGQASKSTPLGAVAKFATGGKATGKKDLGMMAAIYGNVYVAQVAMGANDAHTVKAFLEAEAYPGPSLIIAYSHCIAHGIDMSKGLTQQKMAVDSGYWPLYRYNPTLVAEGKNPFQLDSKAPAVPLKDYLLTEGRYRILQQNDPAASHRLIEMAEKAAEERWRHYKQLAELV